MSEKDKNFHEFALKSSLFKGHSDWYFCYLKSERIAHVLTILVEHSGRSAHGEFWILLEHAHSVPTSIAHLCAGELELANILAEIFSLISSIRFLSTGKSITEDTALILVEEYEALAEKLDAGTRLSPFVTSDDFLIPSIRSNGETPIHLSSELAKRTHIVQRDIKDNSKGRTIEVPLHSNVSQSKEQQDRLVHIFNFVREHQRVSIKDIRRLAEKSSDPIVRNCSEKTIQRELTELIRQGLVRRVGERRWSMYEAVLGI